MRIVAVSDLHLDESCLWALLVAADLADLVIVAGDLAHRHDGLESYAARLEPIHEKTIMVAGNNETLDALRAATSAQVLHGNSMTFRGAVIAGLGGGVPPIEGVPFPSFDLDESDARRELGKISKADILVTHAPPKGVADLFGGRSIGSRAVREAVERLEPRIHLCGHVHDCWGQRGRIGRTVVANLGPVPVFIDFKEDFPGPAK